MLPTVLAGQLQEALADYIETTFPMTNPVFRGSIENLLNTGDSFYHEPYIAVRLPFRVADEADNLFQSIQQTYKPYLHQQLAFERLTGADPLSTLIATGTGSGKTECFLYPILEYCYAHRGEPGIKALLIYPMNALASDQAKRIAELIYHSPQLRGNVTAGMYVGGYEANAIRAMSEDKIITDHETMLSNPPDILLTNYKMLDYLLVRPRDASLWQNNADETLKYIAVDELHTFDGAQGTDLACLLRRLKARLTTPDKYLCCIGTSATMGAKDSAAGIRQYATEVFGEPFDDNAVITEDRLSPAEFFDGCNTIDFTIPTDNDIQELIACREDDDQQAYLAKAAQSWIGPTFADGSIMNDENRLLLRERLMEHGFLKNLLEFMGSSYVQPSFICKELAAIYPQLAKTSSPETALDALFTLISHARIGSTGHLRPFLTVQVQVWMRELRRLLGKVGSHDITYALATDLNETQAKQYLPVVNCRDCGETGWVSLLNERGNLTTRDLNTFYNLYFKYDIKVTMLFPHSHDDIPKDMLPGRICPNCLQFHPGAGAALNCATCGSETIAVLFPTNNIIGKKDNKQYICPFCGSKRGLAIIGLRSATAISAGVSQLFSSKFNDDKKVLAFSDNVQDAAHRAGFFNSRTWKFGLRGAIQRFAIAAEDGLSLDDFSDRFIQYWHNNLTPVEFVSLFIAPNMTWIRAYEEMKKNKKLGHGYDARQLMADIENRLKYEIMLEYGLLGRIGRTLEKSGASVLGFDNKQLRKVSSLVKERIINELGALAAADDIIFERMVLGFLHIMRSSGAFNDSVFNTFTNKDGDSYLLSNEKVRWLPGLHYGRNTPRFIYEPVLNGKRQWSFDEISTASRYTAWMRACIDEVLIGADIPQHAAKIILAELIKEKMLISMPSPQTYRVWALDKKAVHVSTAVTQLKCDSCGTVVSVSAQNADIFAKAPCQRDKCAGHVAVNKNTELGYYSKLYRSGDLVRVVAREHTGLLERDNREELERAFKKSATSRNPWDANVLSCTPTLEMGIDIGDLSTVILCNIPPAQAQYLQRSGRAGRKDGNALTVAVANARPHDLYFYTDPLEMISGTVEPPKIFLQASAVLERQFVAFCMDNWIKKGVPEDAIPRNVGVCLSRLADKPQDIFPFNLLNFIQNNLSELLTSFLLLFTGDKLADNAVNELQIFAKGDGVSESPMHLKILEAFNGLKKQRDALNISIKQLKIFIKEFEDKPQDQSYDKEIKELNGERMALLDVIRNMNKKDVFNFLSDEGLLPNYAFPEAGIVLKAVLYRKETADITANSGEKRKYEKMVYEYNRSASSAISEFAPSNSFYVDGRKLSIDQVDLTTAQTAKWRLCPNCPHAQLAEADKDVASCPQCGSPAWADIGQVRSMLKVQMVYSFMDYTKSMIGDESEDRTSIFYCKQMLIDVDEDHDIAKAYSMNNDEFPFGYEFVKKATMREINFGESDLVGERLTISGSEEVRKGFKICKYCGKIQPEGGEAKHTYTCRAKNSRPEDTESSEEYLFLYREFVTEALRLLVPATTMDSTTVRQESFIAAFMLGMKEYFGNVDHLRACLSEIPVPDSDYRKQYLVIYDSVPGGTGYLKQLMQHNNALIEIFEKALAVLENCECKNDPQKDGCYHCLYAYRQSKNIGQISRSAAIKLLKEILSGKGNIEEIPKLGNVSVNSLFESELERRFIEALARMGNDNRKLEINKALIKSKEGYLLKIGDYSWEIEPQVELYAEHGVPVKSRADFVLWPVRPSGGQKPVAIFTDGFLYHKDKVADDTLKREAIRRSGRFRVWALSWKDVQNVFQNQGDYAADTLNYDKMPSGSKLYKQSVTHGNAQDLQPYKLTAFELLIKYLEMLNADEIFAVHARAYSLSLLDAATVNNATAFAEWNQIISPVMTAMAADRNRFELTDSLFGTWIPGKDASHLKISAGISITEMKTTGADAMPVVCSILDDDIKKRTDKYESAWNGFWQFFNMLQFSDNFYAVSATGIDLMVYNSIPIAASEPIIDHGIYAAQWVEIFLQIFDEQVKEFAKKLMESGVIPPSAIGFELENAQEAVIAECELAWEIEKIAVLMPEQEEYRELFLAEGWVVFSVDDEITPDNFHEREI